MQITIKFKVERKHTLKALRVAIERRKTGSWGCTPLRTESCAVALALKEKFPQSEISVTYSYVTIDGELYATSKNLHNFILRADKQRDKGLSPATFVIKK